MAAQNAGKALCGVFALLSSSGKAGVENRTLISGQTVKDPRVRLCIPPAEGCKKGCFTERKAAFQSL